MKKAIAIICAFIMIMVLPGCASRQDAATVVATTKPVYDFTVYLCRGTDITVSQLVTENVSCLHNYTLQVRQMRDIEAAQLIVISGAGLEDFLNNALHNTDNIIDASVGITPLCGNHSHEHAEDHHETDPHIWLSTKNARQMAKNIYKGLAEKLPRYQSVFENNLSKLEAEFDELEAYGKKELSTLSNRNMITFHDGFAYFADEWDLTILRAVEEESGSEASAAELIELCYMINEYQIPAIFTEEDGSTSAAYIIAAEAEIPIFQLNMGMSEMDYFEAMYQNINAVKEALG